MAKRVFFSFHYQDVISFRANVVRNHNVTKDDNGGFFDASIWESAKKKGDIALKRLINGGLDNTSVTVVLIGSETYARRWVQYEIIKSIERGNKVIGVHINSIRDKDGQVKKSGPNPFDYLGIEVSSDGTRGTPTIWTGSTWAHYQDLGSFEINPQSQEKWKKNLQLKTWLPTYDWVGNNGFQNFKDWVL
ncbi:MAG: TIR domain-containing protein [Burkholderiaceae bacterium]|nr:TIR domain-containing protein [Burkholderiaceae bacterium]